MYKDIIMKKFRRENAIGLAGAIAVLLSLMLASSIAVASAPVGF